MAGGVAGSGVPLPLVLVSLALLGLSLLLFILKQRSATKQVETKPVKSARPSIEVKDGGEAKPAVRILYGTQTGTAERFSKQIGNELRQKYGDSTLVEVIDLENYKAQSRLAKEKLVIFLMATYGDGEPTDNAADFYNWLLAEADAVDKGEKEAPLKVRCARSVGRSSPVGVSLSWPDGDASPAGASQCTFWLLARSAMQGRSSACAAAVSAASCLWHASFICATKLSATAALDCHSFLTSCPTHAFRACAHRACRTPSLAWATSSTSTFVLWARRCLSRCGR